MAEMKCYTCIGYEKARKKGKIKTSNACDGCWTPDWEKLTPELKKIYTWLSKLSKYSLEQFVRFWEGSLSDKKLLELKLQPEIKKLLETDVPAHEYPYVEHFIEQMCEVNKVRTVKVFIGDKFKFMVSKDLKPLSLEVVQLTPEHVVARNKHSDGNIKVLYTTLLDTNQVIGKQFERIRR